MSWASIVARWKEAVLDKATIESSADTRPPRFLLQNYLPEALPGDVELLCRGESKDHMTPVYVNGTLLALSSPVFESMLVQDCPELGIQRRAKRLTLPRIHATYMQMLVDILRYESIELSVEDAAPVLQIATEYQVSKVVHFCQAVRESSLTHGTALQSFISSTDQPPFGASYVCKHASAILTETSVCSLPKDKLAYLLSSDSLSLDEPKIFKLLIAWALSRVRSFPPSSSSSSSSSSPSTDENKGGFSRANFISFDAPPPTDDNTHTSSDSKSRDIFTLPTSSSSSSSSSSPTLNKPKSDRSFFPPSPFVAQPASQQLKAELADLLKYIRFPLFDLAAFATTVDAMGVLSKADTLQLYMYIGCPEEKRKSLLPPNFKFNIAPRSLAFHFPRSTILTGNKALQVYKMLTSTMKSVPSNLSVQMLYCSRKDGATPAQFHGKVNNKGPTLTAMKMDWGIVLGMFSDKYQGNNNYRSSSNSWIGCICNDGKIAKFLPSNTNHIYDGSNYMPTFGSGHDIYTSAQLQVSFSQSTYTTVDKKINATANFSSMFRGGKAQHIECFLVKLK